jgi:hypothetical protein
VPTSDPVGTALASLGAGAATGAAVITVGTIVLRAGWGADAPNSPIWFLPVVLFVGVVAAVVVCWRLSRPIEDYFRRGIAVAIAVFAALLLAGLAAPADIVGGILGLVIYLLLLIGADVLALLKWRRAGSA